MTRITAVVLAIVSLFFTACSGYSESQEEVTLITGGYGYEVGDIVLIDNQKEPEPGDIVQYDAEANKSHCMAFGPGVYLARIIGLPGDRVSFSRCDFKVNEYTGSSRCGEGIWPSTQIVMWGTDKYEDIASMELRVPVDEFLADSFIGLECTGEIDETGSSISYHRFTIKRQAVKGVILKKVGYDEEFAEREKNVVY